MTQNGAPDVPPVGGASRLRWAQSLRVRLLVATMAGLAVAMVLAGFVLSELFQKHVQGQFEVTLAQQLDQLTARLEFDALGEPIVAGQLLSDPRWSKPYSGLYWQLDEITPEGRGRKGVLRSRSLWDTSLVLPPDTLADGAVHVHKVAGPQGAALLAMERTVQASADSGARWRLAVAADMHAMQAANAQFTQVLALSLGILLLLLAAASWAQVAVGLRPLKALHRGLHKVRQGQDAQLQGTYPAEVQPLVDDFNSVLGYNAEGVARARAQAGNLAHALKTPLTVLDQAACVPAIDGAALAAVVHEQVQVARRHIDWHLARSRAAVASQQRAQRTVLAPVVAGLVRVMDKVYAERGVHMVVELSETPDRPACLAVEAQDLQEMLGNLLDNAFKWASSTVWLRVRSPMEGAAAGLLSIEVEDDGPGIQADQHARAMARGVRLDENVPGTGLGLAIVQDLAGLYGGRLMLQPAPPGSAGGLCAILVLPVASSPDVNAA